MRLFKIQRKCDIDYVLDDQAAEQGSDFAILGQTVKQTSRWRDKHEQNLNNTA